MIRRKLYASIVGIAAIFMCSLSWAGPIFLTGHDPDFHAQLTTSAQNLLKSGLGFVTGGSYSNPVDGAAGSLTLGAGKFLWVESRIGDPGLPSLPGGYFVGEAGLNAIGLSLGTHYDRVNGAEFASVNLADYSAIAIASTFGGLLRKAEIDALKAREAEIASYVNAGGGVMALSQSFQGPRSSTHLQGLTDADLYGFLPISVSSIPPAPPFNVTAAGAADPFDLFTSDLNDPTHNSFGLIGGLTALDLDQSNQATTLAGIVQIGGGGFIPEPSVVALFAAGFFALGLARRRSGKPVRFI